MAESSFPIEIFCAYAHEDEAWLHKLETHLSVLRQQGFISLWHDRLLTPGVDWSQHIDTHLDSASVILLLISADFLASDYCYGIEMKRALKRQAAEQAQVIPILVRPVDWKAAPFAHLQVLPTNAKAITTWSNRDEALVDVVAGIRRATEDLPLLSASVSRTALPTIWMLPFPRNSFFIGRDNLLVRLHNLLHVDQTAAFSQSPQAISGLGGIGKTQIAVEYAYRNHQEYEAVLWARAESQEALNSSYSIIAVLLHLQEREAKEQEIVIQAVKRWLQANRNWLLILDNADDLDLLPPFLPPTVGGHILITTRAWDMQRLATRLEIETFSDMQGALFLLRRAGLLAADVSLEQARSTELELAIQLTQQMGGLPLALDQAGAYLEATGMDLKEYQRIYQHHQQTLLQERRSRVPDHPDSVATTWLFSFERVEEKNPAAADLLRFCAYLAPNAIPEEIITQGALHLGSLLESVAADPFLLAQAVEVLRAYSLLGRNPRTRTLSIHRLVQAVLKANMKDETQHQWAERTVRAIDLVFPDVTNVTLWEQCERLLPHALACAELINVYDLEFPEAARLLNRIGYCLDDHAQYEQAEPFYRRALALRERVLGPDHPDTMASLNNLAYLYRGQGKDEPTEPLLRRILTITEQALGSNHPNTATSLNNLALFYVSQEKYELAEPLLKRALAIWEKTLGSNHPSMATSLNNLAVLYVIQGRYEQAKSLYLRALAIREQKLGTEHPDIATIRENYNAFIRSMKREEEGQS